MPDDSAKPVAGQTPESGIGQTTSAGTRGFLRQDAAELGAHLVDALAEDVAVGAREVDVLEDAVGERRRRKRMQRAQAAVADDHHLAGLDVAHVGRADQIERAGLGADDVGVAEPAERERPEAVRVARRDQAVLGQQHEREGPGDLRDRLDQRVLDRCARASARRGAARPRCRCWSGRSIRRGRGGRAARGR